MEKDTKKQCSIDRSILKLKPGITGPASFKYRNEEQIRAGKKDAEEFNREQIWPDKVKLNVEYIKDWSITKDLTIILKTVFGNAKH